MSETSQPMPDSVQEITDEMEETRSELASKLETLGRRISGTVEDVGETVEAVVETTNDTIEAVKDTFNIPKQIEDHPWIAMGCSILIGYLGGKLLIPAASSPDRHVGPSANGHTAPITQKMSAASADLHGNGKHRFREHTEPQETSDQSEGWFSGLSEEFGSVLNVAKSMAVGTLFSVVRDAVTHSLPEDLKSEVAKFFDNATEKAGGKPMGNKAASESNRTSDSEEKNRSQERFSTESSST